MTHTVTLAWYEILLAAICGLMRFVDSIMRGKQVELHSKKNGLRNDVMSTCAEASVGKLLNRYWNMGVGTPDDPDVGETLEVRWTEEHHRLLLREKDKDHRRYVLVRGTIPTFEVIGYIPGADGKQAQWLRDPNGEGPAYFVPASALRTFPDNIREHCREMPYG